MNIKKLIGTSMIALLVVAMGVSMAAAADVTMPNPIINALNGSDETTVTVTVTGAVLGDREVYIETDNSNLQAKLVGQGIDTDWVAGYPGVSRTYTTTESDYTFDLSINGTSEGTVSVQDKKAGGGSISVCDSTVVSSQVNKIPEFATLAIPVVALLGLVLFMRRKKD